MFVLPEGTAAGALDWAAVSVGAIGVTAASGSLDVLSELVSAPPELDSATPPPRSTVDFVTLSEVSEACELLCAPPELESTTPSPRSTVDCEGDVTGGRRWPVP